jgi:hypothetical protein
MKTAGKGLFQATLALEAAIDVDGDVQLWRQKLHIRQPPDLKDEAALLVREAMHSGCDGELFRKGEGMVFGRFKCDSFARLKHAVKIAHRPRKEGGACAFAKRGAIGFLHNSNAGEFVLFTKAVPKEKCERRLEGVFALLTDDLDSQAGLQALSEVAANGGEFDPPLQAKLTKRHA